MLFGVTILLYFIRILGSSPNYCVFVLIISFNLKMVGALCTTLTKDYLHVNCSAMLMHTCIKYTFMKLHYVKRQFITARICIQMLGDCCLYHSEICGYIQRNCHMLAQTGNHSREMKLRILCKNHKYHRLSYY